MQLFRARGLIRRWQLWQKFAQKNYDVTKVFASDSLRIETKEKRAVAICLADETRLVETAERSDLIP